jgi:alkanesulfonate monooxygenase
MDPSAATPARIGGHEVAGGRARGVAAEAEVHNSTALVGTPEQVVDSILDYYDAGITTLLIRGFDAYADTLEYGKELIPLLREEVAKRDRA